MLPDEQVRIVDPETCRELPADRIGEIWVSSPSVAQGYWNKPEATEQTFRRASRATAKGRSCARAIWASCTTASCSSRAGIKDLIIVRGVNRYPQDIEMTVERASERIQPQAVAAFAVDLQGASG